MFDDPRVRRTAPLNLLCRTSLRQRAQPFVRDGKNRIRDHGHGVWRWFAIPEALALDGQRRGRRQRDYFVILYQGSVTGKGSVVLAATLRDWQLTTGH